MCKTNYRNIPYNFFVVEVPPTIAIQHFQQNNFHFLHYLFLYKKKVILNAPLPRTDKHFEAPLLGLLWIILPDSTMFCFRRYNLLVNRVNRLWLYLLAIISYSLNNWSNLKYFIVTISAILGYLSSTVQYMS